MQKVIEDFVKRVEEDFPTHTLELLDPEILATFSFAQSLVSHIPPHSILPSSETLSSYLSSLSSKKPLVIVGESGIGKSTLLANYLLSLYSNQIPQEETSTQSPTSPKPAFGSSPPKPSFGSSPTRFHSTYKNPLLSSSPTKSSPISVPLPSDPSTPKFGSYYSSKHTLTTSPAKRLEIPDENIQESVTASTPTINTPNKENIIDNNNSDKNKEQVIVIPHFVGCFPSSTNRYEIIRKIILTLQKKLHILYSFLFLPHH
jgi:GTPase SAR1 family protein